MSQRITKLLDGIHVERYPICCEKSKLITESFVKSEGEPQIIRRAKALSHVLDNIPIFIQDSELIVGNSASKPMGIEIDFDYGIWSPEEIQCLIDEGYLVTEDDKAAIVEMNKYWCGKNLVDNIGRLLDDERLWPFKQSGVVLPPWNNRTEGSGGGYAQSGMGLGPGFLLFSVDIPKVLNEGLNSIINDAEKELRNVRINDNDSIKKIEFLTSVIIGLRAATRFADRFSKLANELVIKEKSPVRKKELERIVETCRRVPANPARNFYEAIQSFWFIFLLINPSPTVAAGRFDQYMYSFYKEDKEAGKISEEEALELLQCLRLKDMELNRISGKINRQKNSGMAKWHNWTIGGVKPDGSDATNEMTYLILEAAKRCRTPHHTITLRVHDGTPEALMFKAIDVVKTGIGMPAFVGDRSYIEFLLHNGVPIREARDYIMTGCIDVNIPGKSRIAAYDMFIVPVVFDIFMHNGIDRKTGKRVGPATGELESFTTFDALMDAFKKQLFHCMSLSAECNNIHLHVCKQLFPEPVRSSLMINAIKEGKDLLDRTFPLENAAVLNAVGMINVADSIAAIKKLIFDEKKISMEELKVALETNWAGDKNEQIRQLCIAAPKYGNDDDYVDNIVKDLYQFWAENTIKFKNIYGGTMKPTGISISAQWPGGALTGATPDGRYSGECLADGTMSPMHGRDIHGPTAIIKSALKVDQVPYQATLLNMKFHPSAVQNIEDVEKLSSLIRTYFSLGGKHIQFNVVSKDIMLEAQKRPENYRDLIVRVAGYSAYFVQLGKVVQDEIINRKEYDTTD